MALLRSGSATHPGSHGAWGMRHGRCWPHPGVGRFPFVRLGPAHEVIQIDRYPSVASPQPGWARHGIC